MRTRPLLTAVLAGSLLLTACGGSETTEEPEPSDTASAPEPTETDDEMSAVAITGVDYAFGGLATEYAAGTEFTLTNQSEGEVHEIVFVRLPDDEERSVEELLQLPPEELVPFFDGVQLVTIAPPGGTGQVVVGNGTVGLPGRYVVLCAIQVGADPDAYFAEAQRMADAGEEGPVHLADAGPPHFTEGMFAEVTIN